MNIDTSKKIKIKRVDANKEKEVPKTSRSGTFYGLDINILESIDQGITEQDVQKDTTEIPESAEQKAARNALENMDMEEMRRQFSVCKID